MIAKYELLFACLLIAITLFDIGPVLSLASPPSQTTADFLLTVTPTIVNPIPGRMENLTVTVISVGNFSSSISLTVTGLPPGMQANLLPSIVTPPLGGTATSTLSMIASLTSPGGTYGGTITGTSTVPRITHTVAFTFIHPIVDEFSLSISPNPVTIPQGGSGTAILSVAAPIKTGNASLTADGAPTGVSVSFSPNPITMTTSGTVTSTVSISVNQNVPVGNYTITISALWSTATGPIVHTADLLLSVSLPRCLIATATYGSELSPEVQVLRNFRDHQILSTSSGAAFMFAFNAWYYSFSPYVAEYLSTHSVERTVMKVVLYPLIGILGLSSLAFSTSSAFPEFAALLSGLVASSLIGAFYVGLPLSLLRAKVRRLRGSNTIAIGKLLGVTLLAGLLSLLVGEILAFSALLMVASAATLLSMVLLSAWYTSRWIAAKLQAQQNTRPEAEPHNGHLNKSLVRILPLGKSQPSYKPPTLRNPGLLGECSFSLQFRRFLQFAARVHAFEQFQSPLSVKT